MLQRTSQQRHHLSGGVQTFEQLRKFTRSPPQSTSVLPVKPPPRQLLTPGCSAPTQPSGSVFCKPVAIALSDIQQKDPANLVLVLPSISSLWEYLADAGAPLIGTALQALATRTTTSTSSNHNGTIKHGPFSPSHSGSRIQRGREPPPRLNNGRKQWSDRTETADDI